MQQTSNHLLLEQSQIIQLQRKNSLPGVLVKVNGITCRELLDTPSWELVHIIDFSTQIEETVNTNRLQEDKQIQTMLHMTGTLIDIYDVEVKNTKGDLTINTSAKPIEQS